MRPVRWRGGHGFFTTSFAVVDLVVHPPAQLVQQKGSLQPHFHNGAVQPHPSDFGFIVRGLDLVETSFQRDAFSIVCFFDTGRERSVLRRRVYGRCQDGRDRLSCDSDKLTGRRHLFWSPTRAQCRSFLRDGRMYNEE